MITDLLQPTASELIFRSIVGDPLSTRTICQHSVSVDHIAISHHVHAAEELVARGWVDLMGAVGKRLIPLALPSNPWISFRARADHVVRPPIDDLRLLYNFLLTIDLECMYSPPGTTLPKDLTYIGNEVRSWSCGYCEAINPIALLSCVRCDRQRSSTMEEI